MDFLQNKIHTTFSRAVLCFYQSVFRLWHWNAVSETENNLHMSRIYEEVHAAMKWQRCEISERNASRFRENAAQTGDDTFCLFSAIARPVT